VVSVDGQSVPGAPGAIERAVTPVLQAHGLALVDLEVARGGRRSVVRFFVDKPGGVTIEDCRRFSEEVGDLLDVEGLLPGSYDLEVSSPGLDRELRTERELRWAVGKVVRVWTREPVDGQREGSGRLADVDPDTLVLAADGASRRVPRALVTKARLELPAGAPGVRRRP
jgi:ribosome maturation factor RimP